MRHPATGAQVFDEKRSQAGWRTPSTHWLSARSRPPVPTAIDLTNCCEQVSSRVASDRWCCSAWPRTGVPPPARLEAAEFDSPMGRPWPTTSSASLEGAQPRQPSNSRPEAPTTAHARPRFCPTGAVLGAARVRQLLAGTQWRVCGSVGCTQRGERHRDAAGRASGRLARARVRLARRLRKRVKGRISVTCILVMWLVVSPIRERTVAQKKVVSTRSTFGKNRPEATTATTRERRTNVGARRKGGAPRVGRSTTDRRSPCHHPCQCTTLCKRSAKPAGAAAAVRRCCAVQLQCARSHALSTPRRCKCARGRQARVQDQWD